MSDTNDIATRLRMRPSIVRGNQFGDMETDRAATKLFDDVYALMREAADEITRLRADLAQRTAEVAKANAERDEAQLQLQRIRCEISCRVEHGADSNGHLEGILAMLKKEVQR